MKKILILGAILPLVAACGSAESEFKTLCITDAAVARPETTSDEAVTLCDCVANVIKLGAQASKDDSSAYSSADDAFAAYMGASDQERTLVLTNASAWCADPEMVETIKAALAE